MILSATIDLFVGSFGCYIFGKYCGRVSLGGLVFLAVVALGEIKMKIIPISAVSLPPFICLPYAAEIWPLLRLGGSFFI